MTRGWCAACSGSGILPLVPPRVCPDCLGRGGPNPAATARKKRTRYHVKRDKARRYR